MTAVRRPRRQRSPLSGASDATASSLDDTVPGGVDLAPLTGLVGYLLRRAQLAVFADFIRSFSEHGIRPAQFSALVAIAHNPNSRQSAIARALGIKTPNFVALIDNLERRGLVIRTAGVADRRSHALRLTPAGSALLAELRRICARHEDRVAAAIGSDSERAGLLGTLGRLAALDEAGEVAR